MSEVNEELNGIKPDEQTQAGAEQPDNQSEQKIPYERFKQKVAEANALKEKLAEFERQQAEAETKRLEEANEFKALYEAEKSARESIEAERQSEKLTQIKLNALREAGYDADKVERLAKYISGDDEASVLASVEEFAQDNPAKPQPADPAVNGGTRQQATQETLKEKGRKRFEELRAKGLL